MKRLFHPIMFTLLVVALASVWYSVGIMKAMAGTPTGAVVADPTPAITDPSQLANPATNPLVAVDQLEQLEHVAWPLALLGALVMLMDVVSLLAPRWPTLAAWLAKGRRSMLVAGAGACAAAAFHALALGGNWNAVLVAAAGALFALRSPLPSPKLTLAVKRMALTTVLLVGAFSFTGCAHFSSDAKTGANAFEACATGDVEQIVTSDGLSVFQAVVKYITENSAGLEAELAGIATVAGLDAVDCAITAVEAFRNAAAAKADFGSNGLARAKVWLAKQRAQQ